MRSIVLRIKFMINKNTFLLKHHENEDTHIHKSISDIFRNIQNETTSNLFQKIYFFQYLILEEVIVNNEVKFWSL